MPLYKDVEQLAAFSRTLGSEHDDSKGFRPDRDMRIWGLEKTGRAKMYRLRASFYSGRQHDNMPCNWNGSARQAEDIGKSYMAERLRPQGFVVVNSGPDNMAGSAWAMRRPDTPSGLCRQIVGRFTSMTLSTPPTLEVPADEATKAYLDAVLLASKTWTNLTQARSVKGARGSAAILLSVVDGHPCSEVLRPENLRIEWTDHPDWVPEWVCEQKIKYVEKYDEQKQEMVIQKTYSTRYWDADRSIIYEDITEKQIEDAKQSNKVLIIEIEDEVIHEIGRCLVVWMQNTPNSEDQDGETDFEGTEPELDQLDRVRSMATRATKANTDPSLVRAVDRGLSRRESHINKGHGAVIDVGKGGSANLLETSGRSVEMAWSSAREIREDILQTAQCVIVDPDNAGQFKSGEALKYLWKSMYSRCDYFRGTLTCEIEQVCDIWLRIGRKLKIVSLEEEDSSETGDLILPPREIKDDSDENNQRVTLKTHDAGKGTWVKIKWGPYGKMTASELQSLSAGLTTLVAAKQVISQQTATSFMTTEMGGTDPNEEFVRLKKEENEDLEKKVELMEKEAELKPEPKPMAPGVETDKDGRETPVAVKAEIGAAKKETAESSGNVKKA